MCTDTSSKMQPHFLRSAAALPSVPWWSELNHASSVELDLNSLAAACSESFDVIVIGGGVAGLSAAISARSMGASVLLLEKAAHLGLGATGRNAGILSAGVNMSLADLPHESEVAAFWPKTMALLHELTAEAMQPESLLRAHLTGALSLAKSKSATARLKREVRARQALGLRAEIWSSTQVKEYTEEHLNTDRLHEAMWLPDEGRIQPLTLLARLARQARATGVHMVGRADVVASTEETSKQCWQVTLNNGTILRTHALIEAVGPTVRANARTYALSFAIDLPDSFPLFWDAAPYTYCDYRPGPGHITTSGGRYGKVGNSSRDRTFYARLAEATRDWLPELQGQQPLRVWNVDLQVSASMIPVLRPLSTSLPGVAIEGLGALGVLPGILLGRQAGKYVLTSV